MFTYTQFVFGVDRMLFGHVDQVEISRDAEHVLLQAAEADIAHVGVEDAPRSVRAVARFVYDFVFELGAQHVGALDREDLLVFAQV